MSIETLRIAFAALVGHRFRTSLTMLSITIGAFAIVLMTSLARSGLASLQHGIEQLGGARIVFIDSRPPQKAQSKESVYPRGITYAQYEALAEGVPHIVERAFFDSMGTKDATSDVGTFGRTDLVAGDSRMFEAFGMQVAEGRLFSEEDDVRHLPVCVVGQKAARNLWPGSPVGHMLTVGPMRCRVVGLVKEVTIWGSDFGFDWNDFVAMPLEAVADVEPAVHSESGILFKTDDPSHNELVMRILNARLVDWHHGIDDFVLINFATIMERFNTVFAIMEALVGVVAGIALIIGGVGVMNMLLVSVTERVKEIGIRKALGARPADIGAQFLVESTTLAGFGGVFGALLGLGTAHGASFFIKKSLPGWQGTLSFGAALIAVVVSVVIGVAFGYVPARRAGRLDPILAMRR